MKLLSKIFIFATYTAGLATFSDAQLKTFRKPCIGSGYRRSPKRVSTLSAGLFICLCFITLHNYILHGDHDKGTCNRYTLIGKIIGTSKTHKTWGVNSDSLFVGAFSLLLLFFLVTGSVFLFFIFSFKIVLNHAY